MADNLKAPPAPTPVKVPDPPAPTPANKDRLAEVNVEQTRVTR